VRQVFPAYSAALTDTTVQSLAFLPSANAWMQILNRQMFEALPTQKMPIKEEN